MTPWMLALTALAVLGGVLAMFIIAGNRFDDRVTDVNRRVDATLNRIRTDVRSELDARLPPPGAATPTPTPLATPTPTPTPKGEGDGSATPTPSPSASPSPSPSATPTETIMP